MKALLKFFLFLLNMLIILQSYIQLNQCKSIFYKLGKYVNLFMYKLYLSDKF